MGQLASGISAGKKASNLVVGVADLKVSNDPGSLITTYALGSCIGLTAYDPVAKIGGMLHYMLPDTPAGGTAREKPYMYAASGVPALFRKVLELGALKRRLIVCAAGGAEVISTGNMFEIGKRNRTMLRKLLWKEQIKLTREDTGGQRARTLSIELETGVVTVKGKNDEVALWKP